MMMMMMMMRTDTLIVAQPQIAQWYQEVVVSV